jgi:glycosyltransferase involved in cell wall biosynthesis
MSAVALKPEATRFRPIKLATIDVEECPEHIDRGADYGALWALVREHGRPRGMIRVPFEHDRISREQLLAAIASLPSAPVALTRPRSPVSSPSISVVIPSLLARGDGLRSCLMSLARLDYPDYEVIVVDNRPAGAPPVDLPGVRLVRETRPGISAARNRGLEVASGEIVAFTDDDVEVDPGWLSTIATRLTEHPDEACVTGLLLPRELETSAQLAVEEFYDGFGPRTFAPVSHRMRAPRGRSLLAPATVDGVGDDGRARRSFSLYATGCFGTGANMAFRTEVLRELGGFDVALGTGTEARGGEELAVFARLAWRGHSVGFEPAAIVLHTHYRDDASLERQIEGYGVGYAAMLTALVLDDPRHLGRMLRTAGRAVRLMAGQYRAKLDATKEPNPQIRDLARRELRGLAAGPLLYMRSRLRRSRLRLRVR